MFWMVLLIGLFCPTQQRSLPDLQTTGIPHPVKVAGWAPDLNVGQISGVAVNGNDQPVIFHRGPNQWKDGTFNPDWSLTERNVIEEDAILVIDPETGDVISGFGSNIFYLPHGLTIDSKGNTYATDTGLHQVIRFPANSSKPDLVLGEAFVPGADDTHFCAPTSVAVAEESDFFFVADGYCNSRIFKFNKDGNLIKIIVGNWNVAHSLALFENSDVLCVANREGQEVTCMRAGLKSLPNDNGKDVTGTQTTNYQDIGRVYAIANQGTALLAVSGEPNVEGVTIDTEGQDKKVIDRWADGKRDDISKPHDLVVSPRGTTLYLAEISDKSKKYKLHKYNFVNPSE